ncbi:hypothetical protein J6590_009828 [Homalodisca vitripennis]|nr:hypothetical protein J6590_009828 [Homalodisca vitripennis]
MFSINIQFQGLNTRCLDTWVWFVTPASICASSPATCPLFLQYVLIVPVGDRKRAMLQPLERWEGLAKATTYRNCLCFGGSSAQIKLRLRGDGLIFIFGPRVLRTPVNTNRTASLGETPPSSVTAKSAASGLPGAGFSKTNALRRCHCSG